ncbi:MAG: DUF1674 domain-containing protein [Beijerinckiaceae bacterium]|jgi:hypothetical protein|nr:DUF1674 domain-containing protein [Beijerinckiaceae bacterium]MBX9758477.1 DUF1674 domain-containing protein [Beijerinckiaceae bacterium]MDO9440359.1 DUF1674 domain-containing protein [Beijerinckiaceae bacterium]
MTDSDTPSASPDPAPAEAPRKPLTPEARRALAEADERRAARARETEAAKEINGRGGLDPVRYGDWEIKGLTSDF